MLSAATEELVRGSLPDGADLLDLGEHRLRDLARAERVYQLIYPDLPNAFPPVKSLGTFRTNLPIQLTRFIGREREMADIKRLLPETRLLTLTGTGGCGKTRLGLQVAADLLDTYRDGVCLVELAPLADPGLVPQAVAASLQVREQPGRPMVRTLVDYLHDKRLLLVLDNCEHLVNACAHLSEELLRACANLRLIATSRESLNVPGELMWRVVGRQKSQFKRPIHNCDAGRSK